MKGNKYKYMPKDNEDTLKKYYKKIPVIKTVNGVDYLGGYIDKQGVYHPIPLYEKIKIPNRKHNSEEIQLAEWWKRKRGGIVALVPTIETQKGSKNDSNVKTPDIIWNGERWDFKGIDGNSSNTIERKITDYKKQTDNLILVARKTKLKDKEIVKYIKKAIKYHPNDYDNIIYIRNCKIIKTFNKNKN